MSWCSGSTPTPGCAPVLGGEVPVRIRLAFLQACGRHRAWGWPRTVHLTTQMNTAASHFGGSAKGHNSAPEIRTVDAVQVRRITRAGGHVDRATSWRNPGPNPGHPQGPIAHLVERRVRNAEAVSSTLTRSTSGGGLVSGRQARLSRLHGPIAQLVEHLSGRQEDPGSSPGWSTQFS